MNENKNVSTPISRDLIRENFDPNNPNQRDNIRILISTDILSEGINLHRSNIVINYDLPWNPTRVLQRVGRVNRVGTEHKEVFIYNFFPTAESDAHLGLEANIKAKIQAFHETLGEDAKYITEEEIPITHELFGDSLYRRLNNKKSYEGEEDEDSELKYLQILREIRDQNPDLFQKIKRLPKKARSARSYNEESARLITFFRKGQLKKFVITEQENSKELSFFDAVNYFECAPDTERKSIPSKYYEFLERNKNEFALLTSGEILEKPPHKSSSNESYVMRRLKAKEMRSFKGLTDEDEEYIKKAITAFEYGVVPKQTSQKLKRLMERESGPFKVLLILRNNLPENILRIDPLADHNGNEKTEVILSEYLMAGE